MPIPIYAKLLSLSDKNCKKCAEIGKLMVKSYLTRTGANLKECRIERPQLMRLT